ncbi:MAG: Shedu anti-phage system protein SduA domain-containing protein [Nitrososphaeraceae archaeon]
MSGSDPVEFIRAYLEEFERFSSKVKEDDRILLFPTYLAGHQKIKCIIPRQGGVVFEFENTSKKTPIEVIHSSESLEHSALPTMEGEKSLVINRGANSIIRNVNMISREYYEKHEEALEALSRAANLVIGNVGTFVRVASGDIRLIDVGIACILKGKDFVKKTNCLWLFANSSLSVVYARTLAQQDYSAIVSNVMRGVPISMLVGTLREYRSLINGFPPESEMQKFLEKNFVVLEPSFKQVFTKNDLNKYKLPQADFLIKTTKDRYILVELESPQDTLFTESDRPAASVPLNHALAQIQDYISYFRNNIDVCRNSLPGISVEDVSGLIVIGKKSRLGVNQRQALRKLVGSTLSYDVITYDDLFEQTNALLENISLRYGAF